MKATARTLLVNTYRVAIWAVLSACASESSGVDPIEPPPPPPPPSPPQVPNLAALAVGSGQAKNTSAYTALNVRGMAAGSSYNDPVTGVRVWKVTSGSVPSSAATHAHFYGEGPTQISRRWGSNQYTLWIATDNMFVDFQRGVGFTNWRSGPSGAQMVTFSNAESDARIAFVATGAQLRRYNTGTGSYADVSPFPVAFATGNGTWLQNDRLDDWFVAMSSTGGQVRGFQRSTGVTRARTFSGLDEPYADNDGRYVLLNAQSGNSVPLWDMQTDAVRNVTLPAGGLFHAPALRGYWVHHDSYTGGGLHTYRISAASGTATEFTNFGGGYTGDLHTSGGWLQATADAQQYYVISTWNSTWDGYGFPIRDGIGFVRLDGGDTRLLAHHYSTLPNSGGADGYWSQPHAHVAPDGTLVMFASNMNNGPRVDVFLAEVPLRDPE